MLEINLLAPAHTRRRIKVPPLQVSAIAVSLVVVLGLAVWSALLITHVNRLRHDLAAATQEVARLRPLARHVQELNRDAEQMRLRSALLQQVLTQMPASQTLEMVRSAIPRDVGLTSLTVAGGNVTVEGFALSYSSLEHFMVELETSGGVRHVDLLSSQRGLVGPREVVKFRITGDLVATRTMISQKGTAP
jgi:Tfp pilus assembly protein PilN